MLLYIHIPYCDSKCHYCSFNSYTDKFDTRERYMLSLLQQLEYELKRFGVEGRDIETVFIGGGTPSTVTAELYIPIFERIAPYIQKDAEITTEANPNSATTKWLKEMRKLGVNRVSFGVQSFDDNKLKRLNRAHSSKQAKEAITTAHKIGYDHISLDLIYNCQGDTKDKISRDIDISFLLPIDHISAYELTIESGTRFASTPQAKQENEKLAFFVAECIQKRGFAQYEVSNFGIYQSRHNKGYWQLKNYIGLGAGAVGFLDNRRLYPPSNIDQYISDPLKIDKEPVTDQELITEKLLLGLRSCIGVEKNILQDNILKRAKLLISEKKLTETETHIFSTNYFLADEIALYLLS